MNRNSRKQRKIQQQMRSRLNAAVPYLRVYSDLGMIESMTHVYSICAEIEDATGILPQTYSNDHIMRGFSKLLNEISPEMSVQFVIENRLIPQEEYLKSILVVPDKGSCIDPYIEQQNEMLTSISQIGHNNVKKNKYFVVSVKAETADEALALFETEIEHIKDLFKGIGGINIRFMGIEERLKVLYQMFNPGEDGFGRKYGISGSFNIRNLAKKKLTSKDLVAPGSFDTSAIDYIRINGDIYARALFITSVPACVSNNLIFDITNISSSMTVSCIYEPFDGMYAFNVATKNVTDNTVIHQKYKRDSLKDRKNKTISKNEQMINHSEEAYFQRCALNTIRDAIALNEHGMFCTFSIVLYAEDLDSLNRDTKLLYMSTSKFAVQVKPLDLQQLEGFQTSLPLCSSRIDCRRMLTIQRLSSMPPLILQEILNRNGVFNGLNTINDNLVLLNRRNNPILAGVIAGTDHSGKTFQCKREVFNALISSNDTVLIVSNTDEYDAFVKVLGGVINEGLSINPFMMPDHYGIENADEYSKSLFLEALTEAVCRNRDNLIQSSTTEDAKQQLDEDISDEIAELFHDLGNIGRCDCAQICRYINDNRDDFPILNQLIEYLARYMESHTDHIDRSSRLQLFKVHNLEDTLLLMDYLFCIQLDDRVLRKSNWLFIDSMDELLSSEQSATFVEDYIEKMNDLQNIFTLVVQSSVALFSENILSMRFTDVVNKCGYFKLLNQAAVERKAYTEILNIPNALVNYITAAEVGKGIILTPSSNVTFDDSFLSEDPEDADDERATTEYYRLFKI